MLSSYYHAVVLFQVITSQPNQSRETKQAALSSLTRRAMTSNFDAAINIG